ncbi:MAG: SDR family NAD(P)-dependent oxidoreductase [Proteobacteria bacterium]|nr:SDR family NAD(P)-dependent oxidoreductase [Pseudomonadota bacterium]
MAKTIVITGASSGIGAALAEQLAPLGHSLVLVARRELELHAVAARCGPLALPVVADVTVREDVERVVRAAVERFGHIDVWVNNAGRGITRLPSQLTDEDIDEMMRVNVKSVLYGMQAVVPHFQERGTGQVINVSSMLARIPHAPFRAAYNGAKHYLNALTANYRTELRASHPGIKVSLVSPGVVQTEFGKNALHGGPDSRSLPNSQTVDEVAAVLVDVIATQREDVYTRADGREMVVKYFSAEEPAF